MPVHDSNVDPRVVDAPQRLDPRSVTAGRIGGWMVVLVWALLSLPFLVVALVTHASGWLWLALGLVLALLAARGALAHAGPLWRYRYTSYRVDARGVEIERGRFWLRQITVPHARVQHIDVVRGPIERKFGLATLVIFTAGNAHSQVQIGGLSHEAALALREQLIADQGLDAV